MGVSQTDRGTGQSGGPPFCRRHSGQANPAKILPTRQGTPGSKCQTSRAWKLPTPRPPPLASFGFGKSGTRESRARRPQSRACRSWIWPRESRYRIRSSRPVEPKTARPSLPLVVFCPLACSTGSISRSRRVCGGATPCQGLTKGVFSGKRWGHALQKGKRCKMG